MNPNTSVYLPTDLRQKIDDVARSDGRTRSGFIRHALERAVAEVTGESRLADLEAIVAQHLPNQNRSDEMGIPVNRKEGTPLERDLPHNSNRPVKDIYSPQRPRDPSTPTGYASEPLPGGKGVTPRSRHST
jgi:predicted transcriptional regulator